MKRHSAMVILALLLLACSRQERVEREPAAQDSTIVATTPMPSSASASAPYDLQFLDTMSHHHQMAIDMVKAAQGRFSHQELAESGNKSVADQQQEIAQMKSWRDQWYPGAPPAMNMNMPGMAAGMSMDNSHLTQMSGNELDLMFIDMMIPHHQEAVAMAQDALVKAEHPEIKEMARAIIDAQGREIDQFRKWRQAWAASN